MKKILVFIKIFCLGFSVFAQKSQDFTLKNMDLPNSPAFTLMDVTPSVIERPKSTKAFGLGILNSAISSNGIPQNYAIEVTPFWLVKSPKMNALKFWGLNRTNDAQNKNNIFGNVRQTSVSFTWLNTPASTKDTSQKSKQLVAWGLKVPLIQVRKKTDLDQLWNNYIDVLISLKDKQKVLDSLFQKLVDGDTLGYKKDTAAFWKGRKNAPAAGQKIQNLLGQKPLFAVDFAIAQSITFDNSSFSSNRLGRFGSWLTACYANPLNKDDSPNYLNIYATSRYLLDNSVMNKDKKFVQQSLFDLGAKVEFEFNNFSFSLEYLNRNNLTDSSLNTERTSGLISYKINENVAISGTIGKNFGKENNLISFLGINWGLSKGEKTKVQ
jgi:hypothetical protein